MKNANGPRPLIFGEVLFDRFPEGSVVLGGAPFNVAWHLQAFGATPLFVSRVGDDPLGRRIRDTMRDWDMDASGLQLDSAHPTGTVEVSIENDEPSFDIVDERAYDFVAAGDLPPLQQVPLLYHGSLALRNPDNRQALERIRRTSGAPVFVDVNLRPPWWDKTSVTEMLQTARWAKLNDAELDALAPAGDDPMSRIGALQEECDLELVIVTLGAEGAVARTRDGALQPVAPKPNLRLVDTVGAGDAFSAVILLGVLRDWDLGTTLQRAQSFAGAVVGLRGAIPAKREFYTPFLSDWS
jgi:fructokinase